MRKAVVLAAVIVTLVSLPELALGGRDREYWSQYEISLAVAEGVELKAKPDVRFYDDFGERYYTHVDVGLDWRVRAYLVVAPYYRHIWKRSGDDWRTEQRPYLSATLKWKTIGLAVSNMSRLEYRMTNSEDSFRYRNRTTVKLPGIRPLGVAPYLAEEVFYDFDAQEITKNRVYGGLSLELTRRLAADVYYMLDSSRTGDAWPGVNVVATALKWSL